MGKEVKANNYNQDLGEYTKEETHSYRYIHRSTLDNYVHIHWYRHTMPMHTEPILGTQGRE